MSHSDYMAQVPDGFQLMAHSDACPNVAIADEQRGFYGVQFHPEVNHTEHGVDMIRNFLYEVCRAAGDWTMGDYCKQAIQAGNVPEAIVEVVDPMILGSRVQEVCSCNCCPPSPPVIPEAILGCFEEQLVLDGESKRLLVTIGQFSIARLERSTQLLIPTFDYCIPSKTCKNVGSSNTESPCEVFGQIEFPMDAFFPSKADSCIPAKDSCTNCAKTAT